MTHLLSACGRRQESISELSEAICVIDVILEAVANNMSDDSSPDASTAEEDSDSYEDAIDVDNPHMELHHALDDCNEAVKLFFLNDIENAERLMYPWKKESLYHAHGAAIFEFIPAVLSMDPSRIKKARAAVDHTLSLYNRDKRPISFKQTISSLLKKPNYSLYNDSQAHAELVNAECQLFSAGLVAIESQDMKGLLRASIRIRTSFNAYKYCAKLMEEKHWENDLSRWHFVSGVRLGLSTFNVLIAMLPPNIISLLEFVGFSADKEHGLRELEEASQSPGMRSVISRLMLLAYHLIIAHMAGIPSNAVVVEKTLTSSLKLYPNSVWFLLFKGRYLLLNGFIDKATKIFDTVADIPTAWAEIPHLAYWESMWAHALKMNWEGGIYYANNLMQNSSWSPTTYTYMHGVLIRELGTHVSLENQAMGDSLINLAPTYCRRVMGRTVPMEKFIKMRSDRFAKKKVMVLPIIEMIYLWNLFPAITKDRILTENILMHIERTQQFIENSMLNSTSALLPDMEYDAEDQALINLLRGALLLAMNNTREAIKYLDTVDLYKDKVKDLTYIIPYSLVERAMCYNAMGDLEQAISLLMDTRRKYSGFILDSRLKFKISAQINHIKSRQRNQWWASGS